MSGITARKAVVPFLDLSRIHRSLEESIREDFGAILETGAFVDGASVELFEQQFAAYCHAAHCIGTSSGLDALRLALLAAGIARGEEVIVPAMTFVATLEAVSQAGGIPVVVDVSESDLNLDPDAAADRVSERTRFLLPVHLFGQLADMVRLAAVAERSRIGVVEDACQAHGAERDGFRAGAAGLVSAFSFYPGKNLGAIGDAGALATDDEELALKARALRQHGEHEKYVHEFEGYTARLDTIQAMVLLHKLPHLERWNEARRRASAVYLESLDGIGDLRLPPIAPKSSPVWHLFVVRTGNPVALAAFLADRGIETGRHYPTPVHLTPAYGHLGYPQGSFPVAESIARECLSLPIFPGIRQAELEQVVQAIAEFFAHA